jgi:hypothetical protein
MGLFDKKTEGQKSSDTVPLIMAQSCSDTFCKNYKIYNCCVFQSNEDALLPVPMRV